MITMKKNRDMAKTRKNKILAVSISIALVASLMVTVPVFATPDELASLQEQKKEEESKKQQAEEEKSELESYLEEVNKTTASLAAQAADIQAEGKKKSVEISQTEEELDKATKEAKAQYLNMKRRIKLIYEKGKDSYLESILSAGSITELLNRVNYISEIYSFDNSLLQNYNAKVDDIQKMKLKLEEDKKTLEVLEAQAASQMVVAQNSIEDTKRRILAYLESIAASTERIQGIEADIIAQGKDVGTGGNDDLDRIRDQLNTGAGQTTELSIVQGNAIKVSDEELDMMAAMIYCEAGAEGFEEMVGVASVICNRIKDSRYPDTVYSVLWQSGQFAPTWTGTYEVALARGVPDICYEAARKALSGYSNVGNSIGFLLASTGIEGIVIGKIVFFYV